MKLVNTIKRINALNKAMERMPITEKYYDIYNKLYDKREELRKDSSTWRKEYPIGSEIRKARRHQIELACRLLKVNKHYIIYSL